ncbi:MAG TPA: hypothetical protein VHM01_21860 [Alphaproteobacteria bacterium]|nr:hypothetical protein [Alphaproteobacteria bacterium]
MSFLLELLFRVLIELVFEFIGYFTGRVALPIISFGRARAEPLVGDGPFAWHGFKRAPDGTIVASMNATSLIGLLVWLAGIVAAVIWYMR